MPLTSFCGLLTLQVGASVLSAVFFTLAGVILAANIFDYHNASNGWPVSLILMIIFVIGLIIAAVFMFSSSYVESRRFAMIALIVIVVLFCYWIILCCFSFVSNPEHVSVVCIFIRCPESFWIANLGYRAYQYNESVYGHYLMHPTPKPQRERNKRSNHEDFREDVFQLPTNCKRSPIKGEYVDTIDETLTTVDQGESYEGKENDKSFNGQQRELSVQASRTILHPKDEHFFFLQAESPSGITNKPPETTKKTDEEEISRYIYGFPMIGAVLLFFCNFLFLLFSALTMWSWASELDWADYYIEDEPVVIYDEPY